MLRDRSEILEEREKQKKRRDDLVNVIPLLFPFDIFRKKDFISSDGFNEMFLCKIDGNFESFLFQFLLHDGKD